MTTTPPSRLKAAWIILSRTTRDYFSHQGNLYSASLAFFVILSIIPSLFLMLSILGPILGNTFNVEDVIMREFSHIPWLQQLLLERMRDFLNMATGLSWVSLAFVLWTSGMFFHALRKAFAAIWSTQKLPLLVRIPLPWLITPLFSLLVAVLVPASNFLTLLPIDPLVTMVPSFVFNALLMSLFVFLLFLVLLPKNKSTAKTYAVALLTAVAIQAGSTIFATMVTFSRPRYQIVYGALSSLILFLLWANLCMAMILWSVHLLRNWTNPPWTRMDDAGQAGQVQQVEQAAPGKQE